MQNFNKNCIVYIVLVFISLCLGLNTYADGSRDLYPSGASGNRAFLYSNSYEGSSGSTLRSWPFKTLGTHYAYVKNGETIHAASSAQGRGNGRIRLTSPSGTVFLSTNNTTGQIANRVNELAGPSETGVVSGNKYSTFNTKATEEGIWKVEFIPTGDANSSATPSVSNDAADKSTFTQGTSSELIAAWDVSVRSSDGTKWQDGRVYINVLNMHITSNASASNGFHGEVKVLTKDGYTYNVNNNGNNGVGFTFFVNNNGFVSNTTTVQAPIYKSLNSTTFPTTDPGGKSVTVHDPRAKDALGNITHKIFYKTPDPDLPKEASGTEVPDGKTWLKNERKPPVAQDVKVKGVDGTEGQISGKGGMISFGTNQGGTYRIAIESTSSPAAFVTRVITGTATVGLNQVFWDGKDGSPSANPLPPGQVPAKVTVQLQGAEVHFPFLDMEINPDGILIQLLSESGTVESNIIYWDDTDITVGSGNNSGTTSNPKDASHYTIPAGTSSSTNGHKWGNNVSNVASGFGNEKSIDTWTFIVGPAVTVNSTVNVKIADLKIESISTSNGVVKVGDEIVYNVVVKNDGPSDVEGAPFSFNAPTGYEIVSATPKTVCAGGGEISPSITSNKFNSALNMPNGCSITYEIKVKPTSTAPFGPITVDATIMRPNDVTDPDATNPDINTPPTDPYFECGNGVAGAGCNNIKNNTTVTLIDLLTATKSIVGNPVTLKPGQAITYQIKIKNSNTVAKTPVQVSDIIPAGLSQISTITNGGTYNPANRTITWSNLSVAGNSELTLSFNAVVDANLAAGTTAIKNTAIVTDPIDPTVPVTPEVEVPTEGKITSVKSIVGNPTSVKSGDELEYRIVLTNSYGTVKTGVTVSDALAAELNTPTAISNGGSLSGNTINWTNLTVPANGTLTLSFKAVVKANLPTGTTAIKNTAIVTDPIDPTVPVTPEVEVPTEGKITSVKSIVGNPTSVKSGDELEYRIVLTNSYGTAKTGVTVSDALAAELNAPTAISNNGQLTGNTINWTNLTVPANGTLTLSFKAVVKANLAAGTVSIKNTAIVTDPIDPTVPVTPEVEVPTEGKITSVKSIVGNPTKVKSGDELEYRIVLTNSYGTAKTGVTVSDALASELNAPTAISNGGSLSGNTINWTNLTVPANGTLTLSFKAVVKANLPTGTTAIKNTAIVTDPIDPTVPVTPEVEVPTEGKITSVKSIVGNPTKVKSGDELEYRIVLTNSYGTAKTGVTVSDALAAELNAPTAISNGGSLSGNTINWTNLTVPANGTLTLSFKAVVKANLVAGTVSIKNTAIVTDPIDPTVPVTPEVEVPTEGKITSVKSIVGNPTSVKSGDELEYRIVLTNSYGTAKTGVTVSDALAAELNAPTAISNGGSLSGNTINWTNLTVPANGTLTLSFKAVVKANLAAGTVSIKNTAIVTDPIDPTVPVTPEVEVPTEGKITSVKSIVGNPTKVKSGDELEYRIVLTNSYGTAKTGVTVSDALAAELNAPTAISNGGSLSGNTINWTNLTVPANGTLTLSFKAVVKANLAAGTVSIKNTAIVTDPIDPTVPVTPEVEVPTEGKITSVKSIVGNPTKVKSGDELEYRIVLTNSYGTVKTGVTVSDALAAELNAPTAISNGGSLSGNTINWTNLTVPANGTLTLSFKAVVKANLPTGTTAIKNTAIVTDPIDPTVPVTPEVEVPTEGKITSVKSIVGNPTKVKSGDELEYRIVLTNSYGTAKTGVTVSDALAAELNSPTAISNNGQLTGNTINWTNLTVPANGTLTLSFKAVVKANLAAGTVSIKNTAIVTDPIDPTVPVTPEVEVPTEGKITSVKSIVGNPTKVKSGDELEYRIVLTNSYGTAKTGVTVSDALAAELNAPTAISNNGQLTGNTINWTNLTVPANGTLTLSFKAVVKANLAAGTVSIKNTAIVTDPIDPTVPVTPEVEVPTEGKITSVKSIVGNPTSVKSGDELEYRIVLTNSYGTAKTGVTVSDALAAELNAPTAISNNGQLTGNTINWTNLTVPANGTLTLSFKAVVKANLPTGTTAIKNTAIVTDPIDPTVPVTPEVEVKVPSIALVKESVLNDENGDQTVQKGETITYTFKVFNNGGTIVNNLVVNDTKLNIVNLAVIPSLLNPGETGTATASYTLTQADIDAGNVTNTALAKGTDPRGRDVTDISGTAVDNNTPTVTVLPKQPSLILHKTGTYVDKDNNGSTNVGDVIKYHFEVINNGNVTVKEIRINDPKVTVTGGPVDLAPGSSDATTFSAEYVIKQEDIDRGGVYNLATAEGKDPDGDKVTVTSKDPNPISTDPGVDPGCLTCTITPLDRKGEITVMKTANLSQQFRYAGEKIEYDIVVSNTGNVTLKDVKVTDANADNKNIGTIAELKVGQSETFKAYHTITAADMLQGYVSNIAVAVGNDPKNNPVTGESKSGNPTQPKDPVDPNCKTCTITPLPWKEIKANNDTPPAINGKDGGSTTSVLDNDQLNGQPVVPAEVKLTPGTSPNTGITMNPNGTITVSPETPAGIYEYPYTICELLNPANCSDAKATVVVEAAVIKANNDTPPAINGKDGGSTTSVLDNDQLNGKPVVPAEVKLTPGTSPNKGITMNPDGTITVSPETPAGIYEYPYTICELLNPANCSDAKVTVVVEAAPIKANNDTPPAINGKDGGSTTSVLDNDQLNGKPVVPAEVKLTPGTSPNKGITMNPDGTVTVSPETPAGIYEYPYTICELLNPANCSDAKVTVVVEAAPIKANNDTPPAINGKDGGSTTSVLDNDQLNGKPVVPAEVKLTPGTSPNKGITMNPDGTVTVSPETPAGIYEYPYTICELLNPANCSDAKVTVVVEAAVIKANNDTPPVINGKDGGSTTSVLDNDQLNGKPVVPAEVKLTPGTSPNKGITMNPDGTITVSPETPAGIYEYPYTICELLNPANCSDAKVTVVVEAAVIKANNDTPPAINGKDGGSTTSVLDNDQLNGKPVVPAEVKLTPGTSPNKGITMNPDGTITVSPETPAGIYEYPYTICEVLNPANCSDAKVTVVVEAAPIKANSDTPVPVNGKNGKTIPSVLDNDQLNGKPVVPAEVKLTPGTSPNKGITMNPDGTITVSPETPAGNYEYPYTICEVLNPANCSNTVVRITVVEPKLEIVKVADRSRVKVAGEEITYTITVKNTGGVEFNNLVLTDVMFPAWNEKIAVLAVGATRSFSLTHKVTQDEIENGVLVNIAKVNAQDPDGKPYQPEAKIETPVDNLAGVTVVKTGDRKEVKERGDKIVYTITVENTGNKILYSVEVTDPLTKLSKTINQLTPGQKEVFTTEYVVIQSDFDLAEIENTAFVKAKDGKGNAVDASGQYNVTVSPLPLHIPNVFTPNGDGQNDKFEIEGIERFDRVEMTIINRWGNEVYRNSRYDNNWVGEGLNEGTYYYIIETHKGSTKQLHKGWVLIKRN